MLSPSSLILLSVLPLFRNDGEETVVSPVICAEARAPHTCRADAPSRRLAMPMFDVPFREARMERVSVSSR